MGRKKKSKDVFVNIDDLREESHVSQFIKNWKERGFDLYDITHQLRPSLDSHGTCSGLFEPEVAIYHVKLYYGNEIVAQMSGDEVVPIDDDKFTVYHDINGLGALDGFVVFVKVPIVHDKQTKRIRKR